MFSTPMVYVLSCEVSPSLVVCSLQFLQCVIVIGFLAFASCFFFRFFFRPFHDFFLLKSLPAARKGMKRRKRGFSHVSASVFNTVK